MKYISQPFYIFLIFVLLCVVNCNIAIAKIADSTKIKELLQKAKSMQYNHPDSTLYFANKAKQIAQQSRRLQDLAKTYFYIGTAYRNKSEYPKSKVYFDSALVLAQEVDEKIIISYCYNSIGFIYQQLGDYASALDYAYRYLNTSIENKDTVSQAYALNSIGVIYYYQHDHEQALKKYKESVEILKKFDASHTQIATNYNNIAIIHQELKNYGLALNFYNEALSLHHKNEHIPGKIIVYNNLGSIHRLMGNYEKAVYNLKKSIHLSIALDNKFSLAGSFNELGLVYLADGQFDNALRNFNQSLQICKSIKSPQLMIDNFEGLSKLYEKIGNHKKALNYFTKYKTLSDSVFSIDKQGLIANLNQQFKTNQIANENKLLKVDRETQSAVIQKQRLLFIAYSIILLLVLAIIALLYIANAAKSSINKALQQQQTSLDQKTKKLKELNKKINDNNNLVGEQNKDLQQLNTVKDKLISIISHDFRSPFNSLKGFIELINDNQLTSEQTTSLAGQLAEQVNNTSNLLDNLLLWIKSQLNGLSVDEQSFDLKSLVDENISLFQNQFQLKKLLIANDFNQTVIVSADREMIKLVIRNLISNAIKFSFPKGKIVISHYDNGDNISISIQDNGMGMNKQKLDNIFKGVMNSSLGTNNEKGTGLGLALCKDFIELNLGEIFVESSEGEGSKFTFTILKPQIVTT